MSMKIFYNLEPMSNKWGTVFSHTCVVTWLFLSINWKSIQFIIVTLIFQRQEENIRKRDTLIEDYAAEYEFEGKYTTFTWKIKTL